MIALNFPYYSLEEKTGKAAGGTGRKEWAYARMGDVFDSRVPSAVNQLVVNANNQSEMYIADYNIFAGKLLNNEGKALFPADMKLLSHWNIRDEIKSNYGKAEGLEKQRMLYEVMKRIITQEIPNEVINSAHIPGILIPIRFTGWQDEIGATPEPSTRYAVLLDFFHAQQQVDRYYPRLNTYISRNFEG